MKGAEPTKILSLHIEGFDEFHDLDISFKDGPDVVYGKNKAGKLTLHTFIRGMLFGIEKQRGRAARNDVYSKYEPWRGSGTYEGWMRLESEGQVYRIQRRLQKQNKELIIVNETRGRKVEPSRTLLDQLHCGLSETVYGNTISIGQLKCATDGGMVAELCNYIANLNTSGSIALNITKATAYLKNQGWELENQMVLEVVRSYTALLEDICKIEQEISAPQYANQLVVYRNKRSEIRKQLDSCQKEKEGLLERSAKGRQILLNSQLIDQESVQKYMEDTKKLYGEYQNTLAACSRESRTVCTAFMFLITLAFVGAFGLRSTASGLVRSLVLLPFLPTATVGISGVITLTACIAGILKLGKNRRFQRELDTSTRLLQEIFARHLGDSSISQDAMNALEGRMAELLRLSKAVEQSEQALIQLSGEIAKFQSSEDQLSGEIEQQRRIQWELEQKLEHLVDYKIRAETLKHVLTENERIQEELDATDLAQDTMTALFISTRDPFGLYLNREASDLIPGTTGGIYTSMSIDENLDVLMNTPSKPAPIEQVSSGTMDQIYLALCLATAKPVQNGRRDTMPLIFDDSFVLYDDERLKIALKWLVKAYDNQIIVFTCHQREAQLLTANQVKYHLVWIQS